MCCLLQLQMSLYLVDRVKSGYAQDHAVVATCRERLESEAMTLRRELDGLVKQVMELEVLVVALVCARSVLSGSSGESFVAARGVPFDGRSSSCGSCAIWSYGGTLSCGLGCIFVCVVMRRRSGSRFFLRCFLFRCQHSLPAPPLPAVPFTRVRTLTHPSS